MCMSAGVGPNLARDFPPLEHSASQTQFGDYIHNVFQSHAQCLVHHLTSICARFGFFAKCEYK